MQLFDLLGATELLPAWEPSIEVFGRVCGAVPEACVGFLEAICGPDADANINRTRLPEYLTYTPAGGRLKEG